MKNKTHSLEGLISEYSDALTIKKVRDKKLRAIKGRRDTSDFNREIEQLNAHAFDIG